MPSLPAAACSGNNARPKRRDAALREADLEQLTRLAGNFSSADAFLAELTLDPRQATSDESGPPLRDEDYLILSTIHSAKGQEWKAVYVLNAIDGCIPSDLATGKQAEIEEERRLLYVAMTRACEHLHLLVPQRFYVTQQSVRGDKHLYSTPTRFIPPTVAACFERSTFVDERVAQEKTAAEAAVFSSLDAGAGIRALRE